MNKIIITSAVLFILIFSDLTKSQVTQEWAQRYNGPGNGNDESYAIAVDNLGNAYVTGRSYNPASDFDFATVKYNPSGIMDWVRIYNGAGNGIDIATAIATDNSGNIYVTGNSTGSGSVYDFATIKYDAAGNIIWTKIFNGAANKSDIPTAMAVDTSGNVYVTGSSSNGANLDYATVKYNSAGVIQFTAIYNGSGNGDDIPSSLAVDQLGNVFVTGKSAGTGSGNDFTTIKYNPSGAQQWVQRFNGDANLNDDGVSVAIDKAGSIYVAGTSAGTGTGKDFTTIKYNTIGDSLWSVRYNNSENGDDIVYAMRLDSNDNIIVTGSSYSNVTDNDYATVKYNSSGDFVWLKKYNGIGNGRDVSYNLVLNPLGEVFVTGFSMGTGGNTDYATIKYDTSGAEKWVMRYDHGGNDVSYSIAIDQAQNVYITGLSYGGSVTNYDYATVKYSKLTGLQNISVLAPADFSLYQNFPNPFNPTTNIKFDISKPGLVKLTVQDISGKQIAELVNKIISAGSYQYIFNGQNLSSGVYIYRLETPEFSSSKKMIILK